MTLSAAEFSAELFRNRQNTQGGYPSRLEYDMIKEWGDAIKASARVSADEGLIFCLNMCKDRIEGYANLKERIDYFINKYSPPEQTP